MGLFEVDDGRLAAHQPVRLEDLDIYERLDLQPLLRQQISALGEDLLVVAEEYGDWEDSRRRIDLLAVDRNGMLVVIELKRQYDGAHMDLQSIRYAAMVSAMTTSDICAAYESHVWRTDPNAPRPREALLEFLGAESEEDVEVTSDVRIILVAPSFGRELTTAVLWLNRLEGMDIKCVELVPYRFGDRVVFDLHQIVPLPEAQDYQVRLRKKESKQRKAARASPSSERRVQEVLDLLRRDGTGLTGRAVGEAIGVHEGHARRLLIEARKRLAKGAVQPVTSDHIPADAEEGSRLAGEVSMDTLENPDDLQSSASVASTTTPG